MENELQLPVICTRGIIVFPDQEVIIEVGRSASIKAVEMAQNSFESNIFLVCQKDILQEEIKYDNLYQVGTICKVKFVRRKNGFLRVTFIGQQRARVIDYSKENNIMFAHVELLNDIVGDSKEEITLARKVIREFESIASVVNSFPADIIDQLSKGVSASLLSDQFGQFYNLALEERQVLLETTDVNQRLLHILEILNKEKEAVGKVPVASFIYKYLHC